MMLCAAAANNATEIVAFVVRTAVHLRWLHPSAHGSDVLFAYGAGPVALGDGYLARRGIYLAVTALSSR